MIDDADDFDELTGKATVYLPRSAVRQFSSPDGFRKWLLSLLERGHYVRRLRVSLGDRVLGEWRGTDAAPSLEVAAATAPRRGGRPPKAPRSRESVADKSRRLKSERQARWRAKRKDRTP